jgi:hypothetical protein
MAPITTKIKEAIGTPWQEKDLPQIYPDIIRHYET